jgi:dihydrofolate reductase/thymidylate synthase
MIETYDKSVEFVIMVAHDDNFGIGKDNDLPWRISADLKHFREVTTKIECGQIQNALLMGRKTWDSLPIDRRPLSGRHNLVLTRRPDLFSQVERLHGGRAHAVSSLPEAIALVRRLGCKKAFAIGGAEVYRQALAAVEFTKMYTTEISGDFGCDVFVPDYHKLFSRLGVSDWVEAEAYKFRFCTYEKNQGCIA